CLEAVCGAAALAAGLPSPLRGAWPQLRDAGGLAGWASTALPGHVSPMLAAALLVPLALWGARLLAGKPLRRLVTPLREGEREPETVSRDRSGKEERGDGRADAAELAVTDDEPYCAPHMAGEQATETPAQPEPGGYVAPRLDMLQAGTPAKPR